MAKLRVTEIVKNHVEASNTDELVVTYHIFTPGVEATDQTEAVDEVMLESDTTAYPLPITEEGLKAELQKKIDEYNAALANQAVSEADQAVNQVIESVKGLEL